MPSHLIPSVIYPFILKLTLRRIKEDQEEEAVFREVVSFHSDPLPGENTQAPR
jgi:hypothetical protein